MQELLLALWRAVPAFAGASQPSTFIHRVAHNTALTWRRGAATYTRHLERFAAEPLPAPASPRPGEDEALTAIYAAIRRLPPVDRSLLLLHLDGPGRPAGDGGAARHHRAAAAAGGRAIAGDGEGRR
jgi:RNA polymerase sigma-70 factor (ECF subfamily)